MITGSILLGAAETTSEDVFHVADPVTGERLEPAFTEAGEADVAKACGLADEASIAFAETDLETRARFLEAVAEQITGLDDALIVRAMNETGLPRARLEGERARTVGQLRLFASVVRQGDFIDATIDPALPDRAPLPRPDLRRRNLALGPIAVFGASNFPLAFSVAGGDTASAFAAGCPVVVKGHPAHPGTGELVARAIRAAAAECSLHEGVFSFLPGTSRALGAALVGDPRIKAVGFTGSRQGGLALAAIAAARAEPIPVFAEMSSVNPVLLMPAALEARAGALAEGFAQSLTMGAGQFCTNPGIVVAIDGPALETFLAAASDALGASAPQTMLTADIHKAYEDGVSAFAAHPSVRTLARGSKSGGACQGRAALFAVDAENFLADKLLQREVFGSSSLVVRCRDAAEMGEVIASLEGQLTATVQFDEADEPLVASLIPALERKAGRILGNGWPTGVEVSHAMVHGGPYPATTDGRTTSVGALAIARFLRPVCYQNLPGRLLPQALRDGNPFKLARRIDGAVEPAPRGAN